ncbi:hypothetical protein CHS0354_003425 [Potamilus streckersoni]|nr:hypothetical protein CHS0354_003425 [Potamilus streckersoni]
MRSQTVTTFITVKPLLSISLPQNITVELDLRLHGQMEFRICPFKTLPGTDVPVPYCNRKKPIIIENIEKVKLKSFKPKEGEMFTPVVLNFGESEFCPKCILEVIYKGYQQHPEVLNCQGCGSQEKSFNCALILIDTADQDASRVRRQAENTNASRVSTESDTNIKSLVDLNGTETFLVNQTMKIIADEQNSNWTDALNATSNETSILFATNSGNETLNAEPSVSGDDNFNKLSSSNWTDGENFTSNETAIMAPVSVSVDDLKPKKIPYDPNILKLVDNIGGVPINTRSNVSWYFPEVNVSIQSSIIKAFFMSENMSLSDYNSSIATVRFGEFLQGLSVDWMQSLPNETDEFNISSNIVADLVPIFSIWSRNFSESHNISDDWNFSVVTDNTTTSHPVNSEGIAAIEDKVTNAGLRVPEAVENAVLDRDIRLNSSAILKSDIGVDVGGTEGVGHIVSLDMTSSDNITMNNSMEGASSNADLSVGSLKNNSSGISINDSWDGGSDVKNVTFLLSDYFTLASSMENVGINENLSSDSIESFTAYNGSNTVAENRATSLHIFEFNNTINKNEDHSLSKDRDLGSNLLLTAKEVTKGGSSVNSISSGLEQGSISLFESSPTIGMDSVLDTGFPSDVNVGISNALYISDSNMSIHSNIVKPESGSSDGKSEIVVDHIMIHETTKSNLPNIQTTKFFSTTEKTLMMSDNSQTLGKIDEKLYTSTFKTDSSSMSGNALTNADSSNMHSNTDSGRLLIRKNEIRTGNLVQQDNLSQVNLSTKHGKIFPRINNLTLLENRSKNHTLNSNLSQIYDVIHNIDMSISSGQGLDGVIFDSSLRKPKDARGVRFKAAQGSASVREDLLKGTSRSINDISIAQINQGGDGTEGETNNVYNAWLIEARGKSQNRGQERDVNEILSELVVDRQVDTTNLGDAAGITDKKEWQMGDLTGSDTHWLNNDTTGFQNDLSFVELGILDITKADSLGQFDSFPSDENQIFTTGTKSRDTMIGTTKSPMSLTPDPISVKVCPYTKRLVCEPFGNYKYIPGMKWWCYSNCKDGICPADKCKCLCQFRTDILPTINKAGISNITIQDGSENQTKDDLQWSNKTSTDNPFHQIKTQTNFNTITVRIQNASSAGNADIHLRMAASNISKSDVDIARINLKAAAEGHPIHSSNVGEANLMWPSTIPAVTSGIRVSGIQDQDETGWLAAMTESIQGMSGFQRQSKGGWSSSKPVFEGDIRLISTERQVNMSWSGSSSNTVTTGTQEQANTRWPSSISGLHGVTVSSIQDQSNMWLDSPGVVEEKTGLAGIQSQMDINSPIFTSGAADHKGMSNAGAQEKARLSNLKTVVDESTHIAGPATDVRKSDSKSLSNGSADLSGTRNKIDANLVVNEGLGISKPVVGWQSAIQTNTIVPERIAVAGVPYTVLKCVGAGAFRDVMSIPEWCERVCPSGLCPETLCDCTIL